MVEVSFWVCFDVKLREEMLGAFRGQLGRTRTRPGSLGCAVTLEPERPKWIHFHSSWVDEEHLQAFLASSIVTRVLQLLELSAEEPEILVRTETGFVDGLNSLQTARLGAYAGGRK
jgi:quinol monooxygenase YgiN